MIVVAGEALIDLVIHPDGRLERVPGGGPFNTARTIARLGGEVAFLGCLSTDRFGDLLRAALGTDDVDLTMAETTESPTTLAIAELDDAGVASYRFYTAGTAAPALTAEAVLAAMATRPPAVYFGSFGLVLEPMATALSAGIAAADPATLIMLDPNCRPVVIRDQTAYLERLNAALARTDVLKLSTDDLGYLAPGRAVVDAGRGFLDRGPAVVLITDGPRAVLILTPAGVVEIEVPVVQTVDTIGAGDAFGGAFLQRWIEHGSGRAELADGVALRDAVDFAIEVASRTCQRRGADPPRRSELGRPLT